MEKTWKIGYKCNYTNQYYSGYHTGTEETLDKATENLMNQSNKITFIKQQDGSSNK